jgi:DNA-binding LacI/PurR family transcriptional regulator
MTDRIKHFIYEKIASDIKERIQNGEFTDGRLPPERDLAAKYDANRLTLRKAIAVLEKEKLLFKDSTRGTFVGRRTNSHIDNKVIGFLLIGRSSLDQIHSITIMELEKQLKEKNSNVMVFTASEEGEVESILSSAISRRLIDGIIVTGLVTPKIAEIIKSLGLPSVLFGHLMYAAPVEQELDRVYPDSIQYSYEAVRYLIRKKHRKIALLNGPSYQWFLNIYQGYMRALDEFGIAYDERLVIKCENDTPSYAFDAMKVLEKYKPDAVFAANERLALGVLDYIRKKEEKDKKRIELITVGTYQSYLIGRQALKTVACDWADMTRTCLEMIFSRMNDPSLPPRSATVPFRIV